LWAEWILKHPLSFVALAQADVKLPAMFTDHAVLQRDREVAVWGFATPDESVQVSIQGKKYVTKADDAGNWKVTLAPLSVGGPFNLVVEGNNRIEVKDLLVGDVWLCSGQSNMEWGVEQSQDAEVEIAAARYPNLRFISVANSGSQTPVKDFDGRWEKCTPESVASFSAVGYFFGRDLLQIEGVPIGLIDNAFGGSACEAWIRRDAMEGNPLYQPMLKDWDQREIAGDQYRPANLYWSRIYPIVPYAIRGAIWYQGETNASRGLQYRDLFPLMVQTWRTDWGQGDFPFYWVQLADYMAEQQHQVDSTWAELREAQTLALDRLPNTGQAVIINTGDTIDIHPRDKQVVGRRLARIALAKTYGHELAHNSPRFGKLKSDGNAILVTFKDVNGKLVIKDGKLLNGFAIAGEDRVWVKADAELVGDVDVRVRSEQVPRPVAVRYAWADNPTCNLYDAAGLPATPFRSDTWER
jgi:sialate O-acetylesterase